MLVLPLKKVGYIQILMRINKVVVRVVVVVVAFVAGWLVYEAIPLNHDVPATQEVSRVDTVSWGSFHRLAEHLDLQEDQRVKFYASERAYRDSLFYFRRQLSDVEVLIVKELSASEPDMEQLSRLAHESGRLQESIKRLTINHFLVLRELCAPEQQKKLTDMFSQMHQGYHQRQKGQGRGQGMQRRRRNRQN